MSKQDQIEDLKRKNNDLNIDKQNGISQLRDLVKFISRSQRDLQIQRTGLRDLKLFVEEKNEAFSEQVTNLSTNAALFCMKFLEEKHNLVEKLMKVSAKIMGEQDGQHFDGQLDLFHSFIELFL